jgi:hypothetical protein
VIGQIKEDVFFVARLRPCTHLYYFLQTERGAHTIGLPVFLYIKNVKYYHAKQRSPLDPALSPDQR